MKNKNIHQFDSESIVSLKNMLFSSDQTAVQIGLDLLKNADLKHDETVKHLQTLAEGNIMELTEMDAEVMKDMLEVFNKLQSRGMLVEGKQTIIEKKDDSEVVKELSIFNASIIESEFIKRKKLAEEWLTDNTTDERKYELERQIHDINKKVADILGIDYSDEE